MDGTLKLYPTKKGSDLRSKVEITSMSTGEDRTSLFGRVAGDRGVRRRLVLVRGSTNLHGFTSHVSSLVVNRP